MPTPLSGSRTTGNIETDRLVRDVESTIALLDPEISPLMAALASYGREYVNDAQGRVKVSGVPLAKKVTTSTKFEWYENAMLNVKSNVNNVAGITSTDTTIEVDDGDVYSENDLVWNTRTNELMEVDSISGDIITVRRGVGASGVGVAMLNDDELIVIGNLYPENETSGTPKTNVGDNVYNYTQIIRTPFGLSRSLMNSETYAGDDWAIQVKMNGIEHLKKMERVAWFGKRETGTDTVNNAAGAPKRTTGGILNHFLSTNVTTAAATLTESEWDSWLETALKKGSRMKYVFCAPRVLTVVSGFAKSKLDFKMDSSRYGVSVSEYQSPHGTVKLVRCPIFDESVNTNGHAVALDMSKIKYRYLKDSDTKFKDNIQENDRDGRKAEYITEFGIQLQNESEMAVLKGVRG